MKYSWEEGRHRREPGNSVMLLATRYPQFLRRRRKKPSCLMSNGQDCNSENAILILCPARNKSSICMRMRFQLIKI